MTKKDNNCTRDLRGYADNPPFADWPYLAYPWRFHTIRRRLAVEHGGLLYDADYYGDDLPFWEQVECSDGRTVPHLVVPYTLDTNDMRFSLPQGFSHADEFFHYLRDAFDTMYAEGDERPAMMSVGMHCRLLGRPARFRALQRFLDHIEMHDRVWITHRVDIAGTGSTNTPGSSRATDAGIDF